MASILRDERRFRRPSGTRPRGCPGVTRRRSALARNCRRGAVRVGGVDVVTAAPREIVALRAATPGHVSQFLRVVPRVPVIEVVAEPLVAAGA